MHVELGVHDLTQGDPVQGQVLILGAFEILHEGLIDGLDSEEGHRIENGEMVACNDLHVCRILRVKEHLHDFFHFFVPKDAELVVFHDLVLHDSFDFPRDGQTREL